MTASLETLVVAAYVFAHSLPIPRPGPEGKITDAELIALAVAQASMGEPSGGLCLAPLRQRIESIYWTAKDILTLERYGARTLRGLRVRIASRFLALAAAISLNHQLGRPSRALVDYVA